MSVESLSREAKEEGRLTFCEEGKRIEGRRSPRPTQLRHCQLVLKEPRDRYEGSLKGC